MLPDDMDDDADMGADVDSAVLLDLWPARDRDVETYKACSGELLPDEFGEPSSSTIELCLDNPTGAGSMR